MLFDLQKKMVKLPNLRGGWVSNPYGANQPILLPQLAFSSLLPALQDKVQDEDNDDGQYNHLVKMVIILVKNTIYTEMVIILVKNTTYTY